MNIAADLEADGDGDGFGDETQDGCPAEALRQDDCISPETTILKAPKPRSGKRRVGFEFSADDAAASFECKLDRKRFKPCSSPATYRVGPGKHKFRVIATDAAGNADQTPAKAKFKILG